MNSAMVVTRLDRATGVVASDPICAIHSGLAAFGTSLRPVPPRDVIIGAAGPELEPLADFSRWLR
jgi:hypothetical protein